MDQNQVIGKNLKSLREKMSLTQAQIAEYLQVTREEISYYENGKRAIPSHLLTKVANLYGVDEYDLYEENVEANIVSQALAFRSGTLHPSDLDQIAEFKKIVDRKSTRLNSSH